MDRIYKAIIQLYLRHFDQAQHLAFIGSTPK